jgi:hypothetical protein
MPRIVDILFFPGAFRHHDIAVVSFNPDTSEADGTVSLGQFLKFSLNALDAFSIRSFSCAVFAQNFSCIRILRLNTAQTDSGSVSRTQ